MHYLRVVDPSRDFLEQDMMPHVVERILDTLPTITSMDIQIMFGLSGRTIRWRANRWQSWAGAIGKANSICCWCCQMALAH
jgi:hypothetical protein